MSAIAFYDSGRLLPYRHDLKQKQIEQRNIDAENTRKYIGYAGGAFANMAERTGTIFGGRLGSATQAKDATGKMVDVEQKYGGGTVGAEYAKAEWQKGMLDDESERRRVTHKLGLLQENVKYAGLIRKQKAWGDYKESDIKDYYDKRWESYMSDQNKHTMSKIQLMRNYKDLFTEVDYKVMEEIDALSDDDEFKKNRMDELDTFIPFSKFRTYAEENGYYDPTVASEPRPEVDILMAYLQDEIKFPGMKKIIEANKVSIKKAKDEKEADIHALYLKKKKEQREAEEQRKKEEKAGTTEVKTLEQLAAESNIDISEGYPTALDVTKLRPFHSTPIGEFIASLSYDGGTKTKEELSPEAKNMVGKHVDGNLKVWDSAADFLKANPAMQGLDLKKYLRPITDASAEGINNFIRENREFFERKAIDANPNVSSNDTEEENKVIKKAAHEHIEYVFDNIATVDGDGKPLSLYDKFLVTGSRLIDTMKYKVAHGLSFFSKHQPDTIFNKIYSGDKFRPGTIKAMDAYQAEIKARLRDQANEATFYSIPADTVNNKVKSTLKWFEAEIESLFSSPTDSKTLEYQSDMSTSTYSGDNFPLMRSLPAVSTSPSTKTISTNLNIDPANLSIHEQKQQAYSHTLKHEDPDLSGRIIDDKKRAILGGSVDAWEIVDKDPKLIHHLMTNVLKIKDPAKGTHFINYFKAKDLDEYLGHVKKGKPVLTDLQMKRRRVLELTPDQTKALVAWAYDHNKKILTNSHGFLNQDVYENNPSLHQLLGDMAYRHGGSFMTSSTAGYIGLADAIKYALNPTAKVSSKKAIATMERLLFKQGTYAKDEEKDNARYAFLQDRFKRFKDNVTGDSVPVKPSYVGRRRDGIRYIKSLSR